MGYRTEKHSIGMVVRKTCGGNKVESNSGTTHLKGTNYPRIVNQTANQHFTQGMDAVFKK